ncbi:ParB/RepB/Spo0J family partition protein [Vibrio mediterranei]|uniref:ParB/RepB/Spo0J family partition protein n=1 Tax=Vibrio mediterranei TaxID=689 RepID=UPI001EFD9F94|nr:ParB/RepB/Spo0J family partition protein [Vibrio mediterranei]MCG9659932.1 ParB/RepB/Spo0J family partition protein [Vibrio mediterranei]
MQTSTTSDFLHLDIDAIHLPKYQPRKVFDQSELQELADNISECGIIQPISVRYEDGRYLLCAGERRWRAARLANLKQIPAYVSGVNDTPLIVLMKQISENLHRVNLNPLELAEAIHLYQTEHNLTLPQIVKIHGGNKSKWSRCLKINTASDYLKGLIRNNDIVSVNVISHLIDIEIFDLELSRDVMTNILNGCYPGKLEQYTQGILNALKAEKDLGYRPPIADEKGQYNEHHEGVKREDWQGEHGLKFQFKLLQTRRNQWVGGYSIEGGAGSIDMPISDVYTGRSETALKKGIAELVIVYLIGLKARLQEVRYVGDVSLLIKHLQSLGCDEEESRDSYTTKTSTKDQKNTVKASDCRREGDCLFVKVRGTEIALHIDVLKALL